MSDLTSEERLVKQLAEANTEIALLRGRLHTIGMAGEFGVTNGEVVARLRELESREDQCRQYIQHAQEREHHKNECESRVTSACLKELRQLWEKDFTDAYNGGYLTEKGRDYLRQRIADLSQPKERTT